MRRGGKEGERGRENGEGSQIRMEKKKGVTEDDFHDSKQILIYYEGNGANYHRRGDLGATIIPSRKARDDGSPRDHRGDDNLYPLPE